MPSRKRTSTSGRSPFQSASDKIVSQLAGLLADREFESPEALDAYLETLSGGGPLPVRAVATNEDRAMDLLDQAQGTASQKRRLTLVRQAIALDPNNADAYVMLALDAPTRDETMTLLAEAVRAGERAIPDGVETLVAEGAIWLAHESRPYMRARATLAMELWRIGDRQRAIDELWELLRLNPGDNQGLRYVLLGWLLSAGSLAAIERLLAQYPDDGSATWQFDRVLHAFRATGDCVASRKQLESAVRLNPHVVPMLLGLVPLPESIPDYIGFGDETEAASYLAEALLRWSEDPEAIEWVAAHARKGAKARGRRR